jgi:hypothetical protein
LEAPFCGTVSQYKCAIFQKNLVKLNFCPPAMSYILPTGNKRCNHYELLGINKKASKEAIQLGYISSIERLLRAIVSLKQFPDGINAANSERSLYEFTEVGLQLPFICPYVKHNLFLDFKSVQGFD